MLWYKNCARNYFETLPIGNGRLGALIFGNVENEKIVLNEDTLWSGCKKDTTNYDAISYLKEVRQLIFNRQNKEAQTIIEEKMLSCWSQSYMPMGNLNIEFSNCDCSNYTRSLDLEKATAHVNYDFDGINYERSYFISHVDNVMVISLKSSKKGSLNFKMSMDSLIRNNINVSGNDYILQGKCPVNVLPNYVVNAQDPIVYDDESKSLKFLVHARVLTAGDVCVSNHNDCLNIENADSCVILLTAANNFSGDDDTLKTIGILDHATLKGFDELEKRHINDFSAVFNRVKLSIGETSKLPTDELLELFREGEKDYSLVALYYMYGRYLLISSSRTGLPANLQGIWNWEIRPAWSSNWTTNINIQMNYWLAENGNLSDCHSILINWFLDLIENATHTAKNHYGTRGYCIHHNVDAFKMTTPSSGSAQWAFWNMAGVWLCQHVFEHFSYTNDSDYLRNVAYPLLKGSVQFCLDWLIVNSDGYYVTIPSTSPENPFFDFNWDRANVSISSTLDMTLIKELFENYIHTCDLLSIHDSEYEEICLKLPMLLPFKLGEDGRLCEWSEDYKEAEAGHRHLSHLYGIFPGKLYFADEKLYKAARLAFDKRLKDTVSYIGWSMAWSALVAARFKDRIVSNRFIDMLLSKATANNLFDIYYPDDVKTTGNDSHAAAVNYSSEGWFQIDGNFGGTAAITEMLMQSHNGFIDLLPCLPEEWANGFICGIKARGDIEIDIYWTNGKLTKSQIKTGADFDDRKTIEIRYLDKKRFITSKKNENHIIEMDYFDY